MALELFALGFAANLCPQWGDLFVLGYLDAGTGSLIFQVLVASLVSAGVVFGGVKTQLRSFFSRIVLRRPPQLPAGNAPNSPDGSILKLPADDHQKSAEPDRHRKAA